MSAVGGERAEAVDLFRHLPAIYRAGQHAQDPFSLLVRALAESHRDVEGRLALAPRMLDPRTAPSAFDDGDRAAPGEEGRGFLEFLAGWVALDSAMLGRRDSARTPGPGAPDPRTRVLRHLVENAAPLQAARGTAAGIRYLLEVLFDADVEVLERHWPAAFQLGVASSLGADTLVMGEPPLDRCVTLIWDSPRLREAVASAGEGGFADGVLELTAGGRSIGALIMAGAAAEAEHGAFPPEAHEQLQRLHAILKRELPVEILSYIGFRPLGGEGASDLFPFVVEVTSTVGRIQLQPRP